MKSFLIRFSLAAVMTFCAVVLTGTARGQEPAAQEPAAANPPQKQSPPAAQDPAQGSPSDRAQEPTARPQQEQNEPPAAGRENEPQMPSAGPESQTDNAKTFSGRVVRENGKIVLKDPVTKTIYQVDDDAKVKDYIGKQVKVVGKLDVSKNILHIDKVELMQ